MCIYGLVPFTFARQGLSFVPLFLYAFTPFAAKSELVIFFHLPLRWRTVCQSMCRSVCRNFLAVCRGCCGRGITHCWKTVGIRNHINLPFPKESMSPSPSPSDCHYIRVVVCRRIRAVVCRCIGEPFANASATSFAAKSELKPSSSSVFSWLATKCRANWYTNCMPNVTLIL